MFDVRFNMLLIDTSYIIYHRYYALRLWYKQQYPEKFKIHTSHTDNATADLEYNWLEDSDFMNHYERLFMSNINRICKDYNVPYDNIIFAIDCKHKTNWRLNEYNKYKSTRLETHSKNGFNSFGIFQVVLRKYIPIIKEKYKCITISMSGCEADDIIANLVEYFTTKFEHVRKNIYICTSDTDYLQIGGKNIYIMNANCEDIRANYNDIDAEEYLIRKILIGDISDNIGPCYFKPTIVKTYKNTENNTPITRNLRISKSQYMNSNITAVFEGYKCTKTNIDRFVNNDEIYNSLVNILYKLREYMAKYSYPFPDVSREEIINDYRKYKLSQQQQQNNESSLSVMSQVNVETVETIETSETVETAIDESINNDITIKINESDKIDIAIVNNNNDSDNSSDNINISDIDTDTDNNEFINDAITLSKHKMRNDSKKITGDIQYTDIMNNSANNVNMDNDDKNVNTNIIEINKKHHEHKTKLIVEAKRHVKMIANLPPKMLICEYIKKFAELDEYKELKNINIILDNQFFYNALVIDFKMLPQYYKQALFKCFDKHFYSSTINLNPQNN